MKHIDPIELRGDVERDIVDYLDVISSSRRQSRMELVESILREWVDVRVHECSLVSRLARSKGKAVE